ncbi:hypothetical protein GGX14DRAFT_383884 [Mycena pura]|uniref:Uncharacterized protein n=1 Tax=Mycena pura TaxID=153505 RepID=A0AAD7E5F6_9AGAR|nr:hypothetical protein GGX14DRAFT_383884 [Mycena pura]
MVTGTVVPPRSLFSAPVPWLHQRTRAEAFDADAAADVVAKQFQIPASDLRLFMKGVSTTNDWLKRPPGNATDTSERKGVVEFLWGPQQDVPLHPLNNQTRNLIPLLMLPLMVADILLHIAEPDPAPQFDRAITRDSTEVNKLFRGRSDWVAMLRACYSCYLSHVDNASRSAGARDLKKLNLLDFWRGMKKANPWANALQNLAHVALILSLYMLVLYLITPFVKNQTDVMPKLRRNKADVGIDPNARSAQDRSGRSGPKASGARNWIKHKSLGSPNKKCGTCEESNDQAYKARKSEREDRGCTQTRTKVSGPEPS